MSNNVVKILESYEFWIFVILIAGFVIWPISLFIKEFGIPKNTSVSSKNTYNSKTASNATYSITSSGDNSGGKVRGKGKRKK